MRQFGASAANRGKETFQLELLAPRLAVRGEVSAVID
jgi:hypothetical protein